MKYILKTVKNENGAMVFDKKKEGKSYVYLAKSETGEIGKVDKDWILENCDEIVNLGVSADGKIYPIKGTDNRVCVECGKKHRAASMFPIYVGKNNCNTEETDEYICKKCLKEDNNYNYIQCGSCKRVFDASTIVDASTVDVGRYRNSFPIYSPISEDKYFCDIDYLCEECEGHTYSICETCIDGGHACIIKTKDFSARRGFNCHKSCVSMIKESRREQEEYEED